jgi:hypothetical protein
MCRKNRHAASAANSEARQAARNFQTSFAARAFIAAADPEKFIA